MQTINNTHELKENIADKTYSKSTADVVVLGGGPVGLWTAIQTKLLNNHINIAILEKHKEYKRSHILQLNPSSFSNPQNDPRLTKIIEMISNQKYIPTNTLENELIKLAHEIGIKTIHQEIKDPQTLKQQFPNAKVFVGADGAKSLIRQKIFNDNFREQKNLQYIAEVKYKIKGKATELRRVLESYPTQKLIGGYVSEHLGKEDSNHETPATMRLFIDENTYNNTKGATFKEPYSLSQDAKKLDANLREKLLVWLNVKQQRKGEIRIAGSEKISVVPLNVYSSKEIVKKDTDGITWCLAGDSAFGVPFFKSLNNGIISGTELASAIVETLSPPRIPSQYSIIRIIENIFHRIQKFWWCQGDPFSGDVGVPLARYAHRVKRLSINEIRYAKIKSFFIDCYQWYIKFSGKVPWQVNKWSEVDANRFHALPIQV